MSKEYDNTNTGRLFKNEKMRPDKKDPEYKGDCDIEGVQYWIAAWVNETKEGKKYFRFRFKPKSESGSAPAPQRPVGRQVDENGEDIAF